jgi:glyceraldehyde 3-phosphate dehydrogenase
MPTRVAINGFGRIGRSSCARPTKEAPISRSSPSTTSPIPRPSRICSPRLRLRAVRARGDSDGDVIAFDGHEIRVLGERDPGDLPWTDLDVDVVIEATGRFRTRADAERHLQAGASKVILSAPSKGLSRWTPTSCWA